ncbi:hypothetical protein ES703_46621 [subsurface metagenome]
MQEAAVNSDLPILAKMQANRSDMKNWAYARVQKCACGLIWCEKCARKVWTPGEVEKLLKFDHTRTRHVILTYDRKAFKDGQDAWEHTQDRKLVANFIRNLKRGLKIKKGKNWAWKFPPVMISKYRYFLEWHKDGFPHYHIFIEVECEGAKGMIGQGFIHYYWPCGKIIKELPFKSLNHWRHMIGDLKKHGYFGKEKEHQTTLPKWALDRGDIKIYRSGGSRLGITQKTDALDHYASDTRERLKNLTIFNEVATTAPSKWVELISKGNVKEFVNTETGEIREVKEKTYRERIKGCGQETKLKIVAAGRTIEGVFKIPYRKIVKQFKGIYVKGEGYVFKIGHTDIAKLMGVIEKITLYVRHKMSVWHKDLVGLERWKYYLQEVDYSRA